MPVVKEAAMAKLFCAQVAELISELAEEWPGTEYDLLHRNCCTFADTFAA